MLTLPFSFALPQSHIWNESKGRLMQALSPPSSPGRPSFDSDDDEEEDDDDR